MFIIVPLPVIILPLFCTRLGPLAGFVIVGSRLHINTCMVLMSPSAGLCAYVVLKINNLSK